VVFHHQVNVKTTGEIRVNVVEEGQELLMAVPSVAIANIDSVDNLQSRKQ